MNAPRKKFALLAVLAVVFMAGMALAQEEGHAPKKTLLELFETTGPVGYLMVLCSMAGTALVIEHAVNLRREKLAPAPLVQDKKAATSRTS